MVNWLPRRERRKHPRCEVVASAIVLTRCRFAGTFVVQDLSAGGALLIGDPRLEQGERIRLLLQLPGMKGIGLSAEVVRTEDRGREHSFAVAFRQPSAPAEDAIQEIVLSTLERRREAEQPTVLVVESSQDVCSTLDRDLRALGRRAVFRATGVDALALLGEPGRRIDTVIVSVHLGITEGMDVFSALADDHPGIRRILFANGLRRCQAELAITAGKAQAILERPWSRETLASVVFSQPAA
ncbi:MAG: PilZ domain-containing protein [Pseudomonadota bacterium]